MCVGVRDDGRNTQRFLCLEDPELGIHFGSAHSVVCIVWFETGWGLFGNPYSRPAEVRSSTDRMNSAYFLHTFKKYLVSVDVKG